MTPASTSVRAAEVDEGQVEEVEVEESGTFHHPAAGKDTGTYTVAQSGYAVAAPSREQYC